MTLVPAEEGVRGEEAVGCWCGARVLISLRVVIIVFSSCCFRAPSFVAGAFARQRPRAAAVALGCAGERGSSRTAVLLMARLLVVLIIF